MKMVLRIDRNLKIDKQSYTYREIFEDEFPELWSKANECLDLLRDMQKVVLDMTPPYRKHLCTVTNGGADESFMRYVLLCSIYAFARKINMIMNDECTWLAANCDDKSEDECREHKAVLESILDNIVLLDINDLLDNPIDGLVKLDKVGNSIHNHLDYMVFEHWSFQDIMGTSLRNFSKLKEDATNSVCHTEVNIQDLLSDNTARRMY